MLQVRNLTFAIGERVLLKEINWNVSPGARIALIGANGAGKTTLLKLMAGELPLQKGEILKPSRYRIGYLPQEEMELESGTVLDNALRGHQEIMQLEQEIASLQHKIATQDEPEKQLLTQLGDLQNRYDLSGGYRLEAEAKKILVGLGFSNSDFTRLLTELSGGWQMRVYLARLLLQKPDLLLLDEPTNHLDLQALEWLEDYLKNFPGSLIIVSHDRYFIDRIAREIVELEQGELNHYSGSYQQYETEKARRLEKQRLMWEQQQKEIARQQRFIDRFRYKATKAAQVQSRIKQLEKMEKIEPPPSSPTSFHFQIRVETPSYKEVLQISHLFFRYETDWVLRDVNLNLYRGERLALVGANGTGKTTLTRLITGELTPQRGEIRLGERVQIGYYAQHQVENLHPENSVYQEVLSAAAPSHTQHLRDVLGMFHFSGDDVLKPVRVLSGGEKARVALAKILVSPVNFLIMDEPTNHLDLTSRQALERALSEYNGTLLLISHDRYFLDKLVQRVAELHLGQLRVYEGNYTDYLHHRKEPVNEPSVAVPPKKEASTSGRRKTKEQKRREAEARQAISLQKKELLNQIQQLETEIEALEIRKKEIEALLIQPDVYADSSRLVSLQKEHREISRRLPHLLEEWEEAQTELENLLGELKHILANR